MTPTGAAILAILDVKYEQLPTMRLQGTGYGAGGRNSESLPTLLRILLGDAQQEEPEAKVTVMETVIDGSTPQLIAYVSEQLLKAGAWDVYRAAVQMKKGQTGVLLTVLSAPQLAATLREILFRETTTIGLRWRDENKVALHRAYHTVRTAWGDVTIKVARSGGGEVLNTLPEFEDCKRTAKQYHAPLKHVSQTALECFNSSNSATKE